MPGSQYGLMNDKYWPVAYECFNFSDINECAANPCGSGFNCINLQGSHQCQGGYTRTFCGIRVDGGFKDCLDTRVAL